jgi:hypothetical protein
MVKGGTHLVTGFRDFILRGNIVSWLILTIVSRAVPCGHDLHTLAFRHEGNHPNVGQTA